MTTTPEYDVIIIGGGAAGLASAVTLARARRRVLVVDAGAPRNAPAEHAHNYLGLEGVPPLELLQKGREEAASYGAELREGFAAKVSGSIDSFAVTLADDAEITARRLLITTGLTDELPDIPGLAERWGRDVLHCPFCHGWEVRNDTVTVLADTAERGDEIDLERAESARTRAEQLLRGEADIDKSRAQASLQRSLIRLRIGERRSRRRAAQRGGEAPGR